MEWIILWLIAGAVGIAIQIWLKLSLRGVPTNQSVTISPLLGVAMGPITLVLSALRIKPIQEEIKAHNDHQAYHAERQRDGIQRVKAGKAALAKYIQEQSSQDKVLLVRNCISYEGFDNPDSNTLYGTWQRRGYYSDATGAWYLPQGVIQQSRGMSYLTVTVIEKNYSGIRLQLTPEKGRAYLYDNDGNTRITDLAFSLASGQVEVGRKYKLPIEFSQTDNAILEDGITLHEYYIKPDRHPFHVGYYRDTEEINGTQYGEINEGELPTSEFVFTMVYVLSPLE